MVLHSMPRKMPEHIFGYSYLLSMKIRIMPSPFRRVWLLFSSFIMFSHILSKSGYGSPAILL